MEDKEIFDTARNILANLTDEEIIFVLAITKKYCINHRLLDLSVILDEKYP